MREKIDLCVMLNGPLVDVLLPITIETLKRTNDLSQVQIHLVDRDCSPSVKGYLQTLVKDLGAIVHDSPDPKQYIFSHEPFVPENGVVDKLGMKIERDVVGDVSWMMEWMISNLGETPWVFILHFDVEFKGAWLNYYQDKLADGIGQIGDHSCGLVGYNRKAVSKCDFKFWSMSGCFLVKDHHNDWKVRHYTDRRCTDKSILIQGWDVGEILELNLQHWGWKVLVDSDDDCQSWRTHNGNGGGRCIESRQLIRDRAMLDLSRLGILGIK